MEKGDDSKYLHFCQGLGNAADLSRSTRGTLVAEPK